MKSMPIGLPFDAIPQFGALTWTAASWNVTGPLAAKTHGRNFGVITTATACALIVTLFGWPPQLVVKSTNDNDWGWHWVT